MTAATRNGARAKPSTKAPARVISDQIREAAKAGFRFYVYELADSSGVFYVGKGQGSRIHQHGKCGDKSNADKLMRIAEAGSTIVRRLIAFFSDEASALQHERQLIAEHRDSLTNIACGGTAQDPRTRAIVTAKAILARIVPRHLFLPPYQLNQSRCQALEAYDRIVAELHKQIEEPAPTSLTVNAKGQIVRVGYCEAHA